MALPDIPPGPDYVAAIVIESDAVLILRKFGHRIYSVLPSGCVQENESLEAACIRCATKELRDATDELAAQLRTDLAPQSMALKLGPKIAVHPWEHNRHYHYYLVAGNGQSILSGPASQPRVDSDAFVWKPYEWVPVSQLHTRNLHPPEAVGICELAAKNRG